MAIQSKDRSRRMTTIHDIPDELLELTLLRFPSIVGVVRAAATCKLWRRVIGDAGFRRRFRRLNGPHILGHYRYYDCGSRTAFFPFPAAAGEIAAGAEISDRVSLSFLPRCYSSPMPLELHDSRDGLLAFYRRGFSIIVCCPWTRRHRELYPTKPSSRGITHTVILGIFLLDADADDDETGRDMKMSKFRVLCVRLIHHCNDDSKIVDASIFSERDDRWLQFGATAAGDIVSGEVYPQPLVLVGRAGGSICWSNTKSTNAVLHLDKSTGEFARFTLPAHAGINCYDMKNLRVIGGDTSSVHLVRIAGDDIEVLCYDRGGGACVVERKVRPQVDTIDVEVRQHGWRWRFLDTALAAAPGMSVLGDIICEAKLRNLMLERVHKWSREGGRAFPYELPWTISACL